MTFIWPVMLFSLILIPIFIGLYFRLGRRRRRIAVTSGVGAVVLPSLITMQRSQTSRIRSRSWEAIILEWVKVLRNAISDRLDLGDIRARTNHEIVCDHRDVF